MASSAKKALKRAKRRENQKKKRFAYEYAGVLTQGNPQCHLICFDDGKSVSYQIGNQPPLSVMQLSIKKESNWQKKLRKLIVHPVIYPFAYVLSCIWDELVLFAKVLRMEIHGAWDWLSKGSEKRGREYDVISEPDQIVQNDKKMMRVVRKYCRLFFGIAIPLFVLFLLNVKLWILIQMSLWVGLLTTIGVVLFVLIAYKLLVLNDYDDNL